MSEVGDRSGSSWWWEVGRIRDGDGGVGGGGLVRVYRGRWVMGMICCFGMIGGLGMSLSVRFRRLFDLAENKTITVANLFSLGMEPGGDGWR